MVDYFPDLGDIVAIDVRPGCPGELGVHGISPLVNKLLGTVENLESPGVGDHIFGVRFRGPEILKWGEETKGVEGPVQVDAWSMYFTRRELVLVCEAKSCAHDPIIMLEPDVVSVQTSCKLSTPGPLQNPGLAAIREGRTSPCARGKWCQLCWDRVEDHDDEGWGHTANEGLEIL